MCEKKVYILNIFHILASLIHLLNGYDFYDGVTLQTSHTGNVACLDAETSSRVPVGSRGCRYKKYWGENVTEAAKISVMLSCIVTNRSVRDLLAAETKSFFCHVMI